MFFERSTGQAWLMAGTLAFFVAGCAPSAPVGSRAALFEPPALNDYQRALRPADSGRGIPYTIPPETTQAPAAMGDGGPSHVGPNLPQAAAEWPPTTSSPSTPEPVGPQAPASAALAPRPDGVAANVFTPVPFGQRPPGAEIAPRGELEIVPVTAVPTGPSAAPNVVAFALQTTHTLGEVRYRRANPFRWLQWEHRCRTYVTNDAAQEAFLAAGGPERDRLNLDPDGDGFACWWDPNVYRQAARLSAPQIE